MQTESADLSVINTEVVSESDVLDLAVKRTQFVVAVIQRSLAVMKPGDVISIEQRPYIVAAGCYKIARLFGVKISYGGRLPERRNTTDKRGDYYAYIMSATVSMRNGHDSVDVIGNCSSRDKFFAFAHGQWRPQEDVDEMDVMQKAVTNADRKGIVKLLGLQNVTWDDLACFAKIDHATVQSFDFRRPVARVTPLKTPTIGAAKPMAKDSGGVVEVRQTIGADEPLNDINPEATRVVISIQQECLDAINDWRQKTGTTLVAAVKHLSGKPTLGQCSSEELRKIIEVCRKG